MMLVAVFAMSTSVIFIKVSELDITALTTGRLWLSVMLLLPLMEWHRRRAVRSEAGLVKGWWRLGLLPGAVFVVHLITWAMGARMTSSANATLAVNTAPLLMPFLLFWIAKERVTRVELMGTAVAFAGLVVLTAADAKLDPDHFRGDLVCMGSMTLLAVYLALGRRRLPMLPSPWLYSVPLYICAGSVSLMLTLDGEKWAPLFGEHAGIEWFCLVGLAVVPTILGHGLAMAALRVLRGQVVAVMSLGQFLTAGLMAWWVFGEQPHGLFYVAAALVVTGCAVVIFGKSRD
ncbi:DMT family transporter [Phragmitibacter flavus]|uniref:DMT family transporter n=1 Tax=Phragmitibacter flavus TaxID=2576071 RepID=A0A5R8KG09_9BACT|nr:DMT family transporter [Phragmitibacter flavus]TLD71244.1 DMT family transporter [Phragmitibacter flavus]